MVEKTSLRHLLQCSEVFVQIKSKNFVKRASGKRDGVSVILAQLFHGSHFSGVVLLFIPTTNFFTWALKVPKKLLAKPGLTQRFSVLELTLRQITSFRCSARKMSRCDNTRCSLKKCFVTSNTKA